MPDLHRRRAVERVADHLRRPARHGSLLRQRGDQDSAISTRWPGAACAFDRAYVQYPVCNPSRTSFLTGLRCEQTRVVQNTTLFRSKLPDIVTLPQMLRQHGWYAASYGKVFHAGEAMGEVRDGWMDLGKSWDQARMFSPTAAGRVIEGRNLTGGKLKWCEWGATAGGDDDQPDGLNALHAISTIEQLTREGKPWMVAAGFHRPHDPFLAPKKYFDLYPPGSLPLYHDPANITPLPPLSIARRRVCAGVRFVYGQGTRRVSCALLRRRVLHGRASGPVDEHARPAQSLGHDAGHFHRRQRLSSQRAKLVEQSDSLRAKLPGAMHRRRAGRKRGQGLPLTGRAGRFVSDRGRLLRREGPAPACRPKPSPAAGQSRGKGRDAAFTLVTRGARAYGQAVRTERWRYIKWSDGQAELYDELNDPQEVHDVVRDPQHAALIQELQERLRKVGPFQPPEPDPPAKTRKTEKRSPGI